MTKFRKSSDEPISSMKEDRFGRENFSKGLADALIKVPKHQPITVGLYGSWGSGKTSIINIAKEYMKREYKNEIVMLEFNPWVFSSVESLHMAFFNELAIKLDKKLSTKGQDIGQTIKKYGQLTNPIGNALGLIIPHSKSMTQLLSKLVNISSLLLDKKENINSIRNKINEILKSSGKRVVVVIDDIDRLDEDEIHQIFKLVKNAAHFNNVSYLLSFDRDVVAEALLKRYPESANSGANFIDKIVQLPLFVPSVDQFLLNGFLASNIYGIAKQNKLNLITKDEERFRSVFMNGSSIDKLFNTPRKVVRYLNTVDFSFARLGNEVNFTDMLLVDLLRDFFPSLYTEIANNQFTVLKSMYSDRNNTDQLGARKTIFGTDKPLAIEVDIVREMFPTLDWMFGGSSYSEDFQEKWEEEKRICADKYFRRYFAYDIPIGDIADEKVDDFILNLGSPKTSILKAEKAFKNMSDGSNTELLLAKIRRKENGLPANVSKELAQVMVNIGATLPRVKQPLIGDRTSPYVQSAILAVRLTSNTRNPYKLLEKYLKGSPLDYGVQLFNWIRVNTEPEKNSPNDFKPLLTTQELDKLGQILSSKIRVYAKTKYIQEDFPQDVAYIMWIWKHWGNQTDIDNYLTSSFKSRPERAISFLMAYVNDAWEIGTNRKVRSDFRIESYERIEEITNPEVFVKPLIRLYGKEVNKGKYSDPRFDTSKEYTYQIAQQFLYLYHQNKKIENDDNKGTIKSIEGEIVDGSNSNN